MTKIVKVQGLQKKFGKFQALSDVTFTVEAGEVVGFIGPNGAGKSTTIRILLGIIKRDAGNAGIFGKDVWKDSLEIHKRSEEHTSELQSRGHLVCRLLLEKKNKDKCI